MKSDHPQYVAYKAALAADNRWSLELRRLFGKRAGDVRYTKQGQGEPGTELNDAYLAFQVASEAHRATWK